MNLAGDFRILKSRWVLGVAFALIWLLLSAFDLSRHSVPVNEIKSGGPPKDGIPAILKPQFVSAQKAGKTFLKASDRVLGVKIKGVAKAYPIKILNWHELVNDRISGKPFIVSFCPLCGTGMVFDAAVGGQKMSFGVSGLLYQSDMLLYGTDDGRETETHFLHAHDLEKVAKSPSKNPGAFNANWFSSQL
jgi:hypothetical protein